jgi:chemotaxis protein MotB
MSRRKRGHVEAPHENEERWLLTYADMITLLMTLFVVMFALSNIDTRKYVALAQSLSTAFNADVMKGSAMTTIMTGEVAAPNSGGFDSGSGIVSTDYRTLEASIKDFAIENGLAADVEVIRGRDGIIIRINGSLLFQPGRVAISEAASGLIDRVARSIQPLPNRIRIEGHTDDVPPDSWLFRDNWQLSTARALAVLDALAARGIPQARLSAAGYAEYQPVTPNVDDASRARNRRVDLVILYDQAGVSPSSTPDASRATPAPFEIPIIP